MPLNPSLAFTAPGGSQVLDFFVKAFRIPPFLLPIYIAAGERYGVPWQVLAAINEVESDYGYNLTVSSAGAEGWMQFLPAEWLAYGVDANGTTVRDPYNPADAIFAAARYLAYAGAAHDLRGAIYAYNHSSSYVESVVLRAQLIAAAPPALTSGLTAIVDGRLPVGGGGAHPATPVWATAPSARSAKAGQASPAPSAGLAPSPSAAAGAGTSPTAGTPARTVAGVELAASPGAPVLAVQNAQVVRVGLDPTLGRFMELRDAYGDTYTYARLSQVLPRVTLAQGPAAQSAYQRGNATRAGDGTVALRKGAWVTAGTVLGSVPGTPSSEASAGMGPGSAHLLFEIRPAGAGPIDPRPIIEAWQLLAESQSHPHPGTQPLFGPEAGGALMGEIQLMSQRQLETHLLSDPRFHSYSCGRSDIAAGRIERPVLATLYFLLASGLDPTVSALRCAHGAEATPASVTAHARGDAVAITALDGVRIAGHRGGSLAEPAVRLLLTLPPAVRPYRIIAAVRPREAGGSAVESGPPGRIDIDFRPATGAGAAAGSPQRQQAHGEETERTAGSSASATSSSSVASGSQPEPVLTTAQWRKLIARISQLPEPGVPRAPTRAAVPDNATSPPPTAGASPAPPPQPVSGSGSAEAKGQKGEQASDSVKPAQAAGQPARLDLSAPLAAAGLGQLTSPPPPTVVLQTPEYLSATQFLRGPVELIAETSAPGSPSIAFQWKHAEAPSAAWHEVEGNVTTRQSDGITIATTNFSTTTVPDGLYDLRVLVTPNGSQNTYESELPDRLIDNNIKPIFELSVGKKGSEFLRGQIPLEAKPAGAPPPPRGVVFKPLIFEYAPAGSGQWTKIATVEWTPKAGVAKACIETISEKGATEKGATEKGATEKGATESCPHLALPDGRYDFRVVPEESAPQGEETFLSIPVRKRLLDNTPPSVSLIPPGSSCTRPQPCLRGTVTLTAEASDPEPGSGVEAVSFWRAPTGTGAWKQIGEATLSPYSHPLNTEALKNGPYELRATAVDRAGNSTISKAVGVEVDNEQVAPPVTASVTGVVAPAHEITILGAVPASEGQESETWAYGFSSAAPAEAQDGGRLPYTAEGDQLVLLRHTDKGGWQIADVPRCEPAHAPAEECRPDGAFRLLPADEVDQKTSGGVRVTGTMAPSGEAWLWVAETSNKGVSRVGLFHRAPHGQFELDTEAMEKLDGPTQKCTEKGGQVGVGPSLLESLKNAGQLRLGESNGHVYGMLVAPEQGPCEVGRLEERLKYGLLRDGTWTLEEAPPPESLIKLKPGEKITLKLGDVEAPGAGWGALSVEGNPQGEHEPGLILGHFEEGDTWSFKHTGLDALDLTGPSLEGQPDFFEPTALKAEEGAVWIGAQVLGREVVARYDKATEQVTNSWCTLPVANKCMEPLDQEHPAAVPETILPDSSSAADLRTAAPTAGRVALAVEENSVHVFAHNAWTTIPAPGHGPLGAPHDRVIRPDENRGGGAVFTAPNEGWLGGENALGQWSAAQGASSLSAWPLPDRSPLSSVALPPGGRAEASESGALAVGLEGTTLRYDAANGWLDEPTPPRAHHINLLGVAFAGPASAFAVGQFGVILHWNGSAWSEDPQSISLTQSQLNAVAFAPSGEGWAVGKNGTILHYDGHSWNVEHAPPGDGAAEITSVTVAGSEVFAVASGNLITRSPDGGWHEVGKERLPSTPAPVAGDLRLVAGLPDGGLVAAGKSVMVVRDPKEKLCETEFCYTPQPLQGTAVALAPFRQGDGRLRTLVSIAAPAAGEVDVAGFPAGDGELMRQTDSGWADLSSAQYAGGTIQGDGALKSDPVLAIAANPNGEHLWAVGGYDGTEDAAGQGTNEVLAARPVGWRTASIWRYDSTGRVAPPALAATPPSLPAKADTVSFAFFSSPICRSQCTAVVDAQPDVNLSAAAGQIADYAAQPGGPAFAMLGGNARGPEEGAAHPEDFAELPELLAPLGHLPAFAALGPKDSLPGREETRPWAEAFAKAPSPFGPAAPAAGMAPISSGAPTPEGNVHRYYSFDAYQNGGRPLRVIVLDNAQGSLEASAPGQMAWLRQQLEEADAQQLPIVVITALRLHPQPAGESASDGAEVASLLAEKGVLAVFTTNPNQLDEQYMVPETPSPGAPQIPEYEGASLGYQQSGNNGVMWYFVSVNTDTRELHVNAVPVLGSLALKPLDGLSVARSLTLQFEAVGRRPAGTLATKARPPAEGFTDNFPGYDNYAEIPAPSCGARPCVPPSYSFTSSNPAIGDFVVPSGPGSALPKLDASGHPIHSSASGLFCGYNGGSTTVSITAGQLSYSLPVTVRPGGFGYPCGTVPYTPPTEPNGSPSAVTPGSVGQLKPAGAGAPPPPPPAVTSSPITPSISLPPPPPGPAPPPAVPPAAPAPPPPAPPATPPAPPPPQPPAPVQPAPPPAEAAPALVNETLGLPPAVVPPATPPVEPIPPGAGGWAQSPSAAKRREETRKHASQDAFTLRPVSASSGESNGVELFYLAVGAATLLALLLSARGMRPRSGARPALLLARSREADERERRRRRGFD